jgi:lipopolysaccharide export system ATP-binding protein
MGVGETMAVPAIETTGLVKSYNRRRVVDRVSVSVRKGEIVGLLGPNGAGKTTTFYMVVGLIRPQAGSVFLVDEAKRKTDLTELPMYLRARMGIGYLSQESSIFRKLTVADNILAILEHMGLSKSQQEERLEGLLRELGIERLANQMAYTLSGGERRRVEITRCLATNPSFILLDEPFVGIDPITVGELQVILQQLKKKGIGFLVTDHNVRETLAVVDRAYLLCDGKIVESGSARKLVGSKKARELYLGEKFKL